MSKQFATLQNLSVFNEYMTKPTPITQAEYDLLTTAQKNDPTKIYFITDATVTGVDIDDTTTALDKVWSSSKVSNSLDGWTQTATVNSSLQVTFNGLNDALSYDLYCEDKVVGVASVTITPVSTGIINATYTLIGAEENDVCKLRILK